MDRDSSQDTTDASADTGTDTGTDTDRVSLVEAARRLGVSKDAVRKRARRGSIPHDRDPDGTVYVYVPAGVDTSTDTTESSTDAGTDASTDTSTEARSALLDAYRDRIESLERQLAAERSAHGETRRIAAMLAQRVPELEPPRDASQESPQEPQSVSEGSGGDDAPPEDSPTEEHSGFAGWFRRIFGSRRG